MAQTKLPREIAKGIQTDVPETGIDLRSLLDQADTFESIPFDEAVEKTTGHDVLKIDETDADTRLFLQELRKSASEFVKSFNGKSRPASSQQSLSSNVANEFSQQLSVDGFKVTKVPAPGYPQFFATDRKRRTWYFQVKAADKLDSSGRNFYYSRGTGITRDGFHFLITFKTDRGANQKIQSFHMADLKAVSLHLKLEVNSAFDEIYTGENLI